jgi:hypothetical protein
MADALYNVRHGAACVQGLLSKPLAAKYALTPCANAFTVQIVIANVTKPICAIFISFAMPLLTNAG